MLRNPSHDAEGAVARAQGVYFVASGVWPIISPGSFQRVTGPKSDMWLAQTVGGLVAIVGIVLTRPTPDRRTRRLLGVGSAAALGIADVVFALSGRIRRVYLVDALLEAGLVLSWAVASRQDESMPKPSGDAKIGDRVAPGRTGAGWTG
jgi:hypothetical protein